MTSSDLPPLLAASLDAPEELLPLLPELFRDLEDLGAHAADITSLLGEAELPPHARVLDLGCGKGATAIAIANAFGARVRGIDGIAAFIQHARSRATSQGVDTQCEFIVGDLRDAVGRERNYDVVLLLALGDLLGTTRQTISTLAEVVRPGGYMVLDDAYLATPEGACEQVYDRETTIARIEATGVEVVGEQKTDTERNQAWLEDATASILARARDLAPQHPELAAAIGEFAARQAAETGAPMDDLIGVTWLLRKPTRDR